MNKVRILNERNNIADKSIYNSTGIKGTDILIRDSVTHKTHFKGHNSVIVPGSLFTAQSHFPRMTMPVKLPSYNETLGLDNRTDSAKPADQPRQIWLFAVGTDGAGAESSQVKDVDLTKRIAPNSLIPFRCVPASRDISAEDREVYFGRKADEANIMYYFKKFSSEPICYPIYADGTPIGENMYNDSNVDPEIRVEIEFKITKEECREWFKLFSAGGIADAKINTMSLLSAWYNIGSDGYVYYQDIQPVTKLNFTTESLSDDSKGLDIIYNIYY